MKINDVDYRYEASLIPKCNLLKCYFYIIYFKTKKEK